MMWVRFHRPPGSGAQAGAAGSALHYLVLELVEGESLADRIKKGPLPLPEVLRYGAQIADALDAAHCRGIIHRDMKPENVMLSRSGAKLLDFGLARTASEGGGIDAEAPLPPIPPVAAWPSKVTDAATTCPL